MARKARPWSRNKSESQNNGTVADRRFNFHSSATSRSSAKKIETARRFILSNHQLMCNFTDGMNELSISRIEKIGRALLSRRLKAQRQKRELTATQRFDRFMVLMFL